MPVIVDAGVGTASDAADRDGARRRRRADEHRDRRRRRSGGDGATRCGSPSRPAASPIAPAASEKKRYATASSPLTGVIGRVDRSPAAGTRVRASSRRTWRPTISSGAGEGARRRRRPLQPGALRGRRRDHRGARGAASAAGAGRDADHAAQRARGRILPDAPPVAGSWLQAQDRRPARGASSAPIFERQQAFNARARRPRQPQRRRSIARTARRSTRRCATRATRSASSRAFQSTLIVYFQQLTAYVDTKDFEFAGHIRDRYIALNGAVAGLTDEILKRWESMVAREQRFDAKATAIGARAGRDERASSATRSRCCTRPRSR